MLDVGEAGMDEEAWDMGFRAHADDFGEDMPNWDNI
jgi:hypothetical protein